ncbi:MAG: hypothetical protein ACLTTU_14955 [Bilophila wadsworthia]
MACAQANGGDADNWEPRRECETCARHSTVDGFWRVQPEPDPGHGGDEDRWTWKDARRREYRADQTHGEKTALPADADGQNL